MVPTLPGLEGLKSYSQYNLNNKKYYFRNDLNSFSLLSNMTISSTIEETGGTWVCMSLECENFAFTIDLNGRCKIPDIKKKVFKD